jgi:hypothetical protein
VGSPAIGTNPKDTLEDARDCWVKETQTPTIPKTGDCPCSVRANPGDIQKSVRIPRESPGELIRNEPKRTSEDAIPLGASQRAEEIRELHIRSPDRFFQGGEVGQKLPVDRQNLLSSGPLEHELSDENSVWIPRLTPRVSPSILLDPSPETLQEDGASTRPSLTHSGHRQHKATVTH